MGPPNARTASSAHSGRSPGDNLKLTIDPTVQAAGEAALAARGLRGGFVTMDVHTGESSASAPTRPSTRRSSPGR